MRVTKGDPQYLVLFDEDGNALCTCTSEENRDALIDAIAAAAEWEYDYDTAHRMREAAETELRETKGKLAAAEAKLEALRQAVDQLELPHDPAAPGHLCQLRDLKRRIDAARAGGEG